MKDNNKSVIYKIIYTFLTVLCVSFIYTQSLLPATQSSQESGRVLEFLNSITRYLGLGPVFTPVIVRKIAHFTEFAVLSACSFGMYKSYFKKNLCIALLTASTYTFVAITDECIQLFSKGRACQFADMVIDFCGGSAALLILILTLVMLKNKRRKRLIEG